MHGINHLFAQHGLISQNIDKSAQVAKNSSSSSSSSSDSKQQDTKVLQEMLNQQKVHLHNGKLYIHGRKTSRGSVSSTYSYGSSISYDSSHGSNSSNYGTTGYNHSVYYTLPGSGHHHNYYHGHRYYQPHQQVNLSDRVSPSSPSSTCDQEKHHHRHHSIHEMIKHFGKRLGHIRRQSECQESPKERDEEFRNRSQSLDGGARHPSFDVDCETTYKIYESILRQGNAQYVIRKFKTFKEYIYFLELNFILKNEYKLFLIINNDGRGVLIEIGPNKMVRNCFSGSIG